MTFIQENGEYISVSANGPVDYDGNPVTRTKQDHPYSYDPFVLYRFGPNEEVNGSVYSDRMQQWDEDKYQRCRQEAKCRSNEWGQIFPTFIQHFLQLYLDKPNLRLIVVVEHCNVSNGFSTWQFCYNTGD